MVIWGAEGNIDQPLMVSFLQKGLARVPSLELIGSSIWFFDPWQIPFETNRGK